jgi:hypothetical protein
MAVIHAPHINNFEYDYIRVLHLYIVISGYCGILHMPLPLLKKCNNKIMQV